MYSLARTPNGVGCPIQTSPDQSLLGSSPRLFAACHVFRRFSIPRHPSHALTALDDSHWETPLRFSPTHSAMRDEANATCITPGHTALRMCALHQKPAFPVGTHKHGFAAVSDCWSVQREAFYSVRTFSPMNFSKNCTPFPERSGWYHRGYGSSMGGWGNSERGTLNPQPSTIFLHNFDMLKVANDSCLNLSFCLGAPIQVHWESIAA